jgi:hypothetical protein
MIRRPGGRVAYVMLATPAEGRAHWRATAAPLGLQQLYVLPLCEPTLKLLLVVRLKMACMLAG